MTGTAILAVRKLLAAGSQLSGPLALFGRNSISSDLKQDSPSAGDSVAIKHLDMIILGPYTFYARFFDCTFLYDAVARLIHLNSIVVPLVLKMISWQSVNGPTRVREQARCCCLLTLMHFNDNSWMQWVQMNKHNLSIGFSLQKHKTRWLQRKGDKPLILKGVSGYAEPRLSSAA